MAGVGGSSSGKRVVIATFGSLGDLHPYLAIGLELRARGHEPVIATSEFYRGPIEQLGLGFRPVRPDLSENIDDSELFKRVMDGRTGPETVIRDLVAPRVRESYEDTLAAVEGADLLLSHMLTFAAPTVAEVEGIPWLSTFLAPIGFLSAWDGPVPMPTLAGRNLRRLPPWILRPLFHHIKGRLGRWAEPVNALRADLGLPRHRDPIFAGQTSPHGTLALFSRAFAGPQPDWPGGTVQTGFPFFDRFEGRTLPPELAEFLDAGPPPVVFTLGSSAVRDAGNFYDEGRGAASQLGVRAVFLTGKDPRNVPRSPLPETMIACEYAPYSELFPLASAVVHQGGVGTTAQGLRSGRPTVIVPWSHDQPDNAERAGRLGLSITLPRRSYRAGTVAKALKRLLHGPGFADRAAEIGRRIRAEDGAGAAADAIERMLGRSHP